MKKKELIFGLHAIRAALDEEKSLSKIWLKKGSTHKMHREILRLAHEKAVPCSQVPMQKLRQLTSGQHQGAVALRSPIPFIALAPLLQQIYEEGRAPFVMVLSRIEDSRNLGAVVRSAVAAKVDAIIVPTQGVARIDGTTMKTSAGTLPLMPMVRTKDLGLTLSALQESGLQVVGATEKGTKSFYGVDFKLPTALVMGGEAEGISEAYLKQCDAQVAIPMAASVSSLNLSVAAALMAYEVVRQREF